MSTTRAAQAAISQQTKQRLMKILFGNNSNVVGSLQQMTYQDLKRAYLQRVMVLHPDTKQQQQQQQENENDAKLTSSRVPPPASSQDFVQLQAAWDAYNKAVSTNNNILKTTGSIGETDVKQTNFTMFGVGCSFSDSPQERALRDEITTQACRGWFSAGALAETTVSSSPCSMSTTMNDQKKGESYVSFLNEDDWHATSTKVSTATSNNQHSKPKNQEPSTNNIKPSAQWWQR